jgi:hypothetical protein
MFPSWLDKKLETVFLVTLHGEWSLHDGLCQPGGNSRRALGRLRIIVANNSTAALAGATAAPPAPARVAAAAAGPPARTPRTPTMQLGRGGCCVRAPAQGSAKLGRRRSWFRSARQAVVAQQTPLFPARESARGGNGSVKVYDTRVAEVEARSEANEEEDEYAQLCREGFSREDVAAVTIQGPPGACVNLYSAAELYECRLFVGWSAGAAGVQGAEEPGVASGGGSGRVRAPAATQCMQAKVRRCSPNRRTGSRCVATGDQMLGLCIILHAVVFVCLLEHRDCSCIVTWSLCYCDSASSFNHKFLPCSPLDLGCCRRVLQVLDLLPRPAAGDGVPPPADVLARPRVGSEAVGVGQVRQVGDGEELVAGQVLRLPQPLLVDVQQRLQLLMGPSSNVSASPCARLRHDTHNRQQIKTMASTCINVSLPCAN